MLPACRTEGDALTLPTFEVCPRDVQGFMDELWTFQSTFHDCFARSESRAHFFDYMVGQCSPLARKSIEPLALAVEGANVRGLQRFISDARWDEAQMRWNYHHLVAEEMGGDAGVLMFDETGLVKKGQDSAGVARQYCGPLGKVDNCQVGVFAGYVTASGYALVDHRLFLPEAWFGDAYAARRRQCRIPAELTFHSKPQLAAAMLKAIVADGLLPFKYIVADCLYGNSPDFLDAVEACVGVRALVAVSAETRCWLQRPQSTDKTYRYKGQTHAKRVVVGGDQQPMTVAALAARLPPSRWYRRQVSHGTKGPITYEFARPRVTLSKAGVPDRTVWLVIKRTAGAEPRYAYAISKAPQSTPLSTLVWLSGLRWAIEQCFEECKGEVGMAHYEVRQYPGWHHHILTSMLAHFFLWHLQRHLGKKSSGHDRVPAAQVACSGVTSARLYDRRHPGTRGVGARAQSPRLSCPPQAAGD